VEGRAGRMSWGKRLVNGILLSLLAVVLMLIAVALWDRAHRYTYERIPSSGKIVRIDWWTQTLCAYEESQRGNPAAWDCIVAR
jgi:hypothetical protein